MDDLSLMHRLAQLMGWTVEGPELNRRAHYDFSGGDVYVDDAGSFWRGVKADGNATIPWRPLEDMNDAMMIVGALQKEGCDYEVGSCVQGHSAMFMRGVYDLYDDTWDEQHGAVSDTPARAICLAAWGVAQKEAMDHG